MTALAVAPPKAGMRVAVLGLGLIGNLVAQLYQLDGAKVVGVDKVASRLEIARKCGLQNSIESDDNLRDHIGDLLGGEPDIVVEATGVPSVVNLALENVRKRGQVVLLGSPRGTLEIDIYKHIHARGVQLLGAHESLQGFDGLPSRATLSQRALQLIADGALKVAPLLTHRMPASQAAHAYEMLHNSPESALGIILDWQMSSR